MDKLNLVLVFLEGVISLFSPCVLPILPVYIGMLSNSSVDSLNRNFKFKNSILLKNTLFFILGISSTFFILGFSINKLSNIFITNKYLVEILGGVIIIFLGVFYMGYLKIPFLYREKRFNINHKTMNFYTAFLLGFFFSFGWTPCIGPMLASVLFLTAQSDSTLFSGIVILIYSLGFTLPFLLIAIFYNKLFVYIDKVKLRINDIKKLGGVILLIVGFIMFFRGSNSLLEEQKGKINNSTSINENITKDTEDEEVQAPNFTLIDQYGKIHDLKSYKGKTVFLNFWATWCPPCREEMPNIESIYIEYGENKNEVVILGVAAPSLGNEGSTEDIIKFLKDNGYSFPVLFDNGGKVMNSYNISALPTTFIIDKDGNIKGYVPGAMDKETMKKIIGLE